MKSVVNKLCKALAIAAGGLRYFETVVVDDIRIRWPVQQRRNFWQGEHPDASLIRSLARHFPERGVFFDIGANVGIYSMTLAKILGSRFEGVAFEPCPSTIQCLEKNLELNSIDSVKVCKFGLSSQEGTFTLSNYPSGLNNFQVSKDDDQGHPTVQVRCATLDSVCLSEGIVPDVCKIDVEGHELHVLLGAKHTLETRHPVLLIESHGASVSANDRDMILQNLREWGYRCFCGIDGQTVKALPDRTIHILCTP